MLASHYASSDCARSSSCREEGRTKSSGEGTLESKTIGNQLSDLSMHTPVECRPHVNIDITCIEKSVLLEERKRKMSGLGCGQTDSS